MTPDYRDFLTVLFQSTAYRSSRDSRTTCENRRERNLQRCGRKQAVVAEADTGRLHQAAPFCWTPKFWLKECLLQRNSAEDIVPQQNEYSATELPPHDKHQKGLLIASPKSAHRRTTRYLTTEVSFGITLICSSVCNSFAGGMSWILLSNPSPLHPCTPLPHR